MKIASRILAALLLFINGVGALFGGWALMAKPDGSILQMPLSYLEHSPFSSYFIPGIILFVANGIFSCIALITVLIKTPKYPLLIIAQGAILTGWIVIQIFLIQSLNGFHFLFGGMGLLMIITGLALRKYN